MTLRLVSAHRTHVLPAGNAASSDEVLTDLGGYDAGGIDWEGGGIRRIPRKLLYSSVNEINISSTSGAG